jgi:hypothetical protein
VFYVLNLLKKKIKSFKLSLSLSFYTLHQATVSVAQMI